MPGVKKIIYKEKEILFINYKGCKSDSEMIEILKEVRKIITEDKKEYLQLTDITDAYATPRFLDALMKIAEETPWLAKKRAIVGANTPGRRVMVKAYDGLLGGNSIRRFYSLRKAKDWLVE